jgi:undecaprenyl-diphosphatase
LDFSLYRSVNGWSGESFSDGLFKFLATDLAAILVVLVALTFLVPWSRRRQERRFGALLATESAALALLLAQPISRLVDRARPYIAHPQSAHLLIPRSHDPSFPSDHATGAFALAFGIWLYDRTIGTVMLVLGALLAFSRVYVGIHYPGDVIAGALLGMGVAAALFLVSPTRRMNERIAARCGRIWDGMLARLPMPGTSSGRKPHG